MTGGVGIELCVGVCACVLHGIGDLAGKPAAGMISSSPKKQQKHVYFASDYLYRHIPLTQYNRIEPALHVITPKSSYTVSGGFNLGKSCFSLIRAGLKTQKKKKEKKRKMMERRTSRS